MPRAWCRHCFLVIDLEAVTVVLDRGHPQAAGSAQGSAFRQASFSAAEAHDGLMGIFFMTGSP